MKNKHFTIAMKMLVFASFLVFNGLNGWGQTSVQNFGTGTGSHTSQTGSTSFIPNPTSGTTWARAGATAPNAPIVLANTSNPLGTSGSYVRAVASASTSVSKFSPMVGYTGSTEFYTSFKVLFGDASAGNTATSGSWSFYQGAGAMYSDANDFAGAQVFTGLRFTFGTGGSLALTYRGGTSWVNTGLSPNSFSSATVYTVEIVGNNKTSGTISYTYNGAAQTVAVQKFDLYINGTKIGDDLAEAVLPANTSITSGTFIGISSPSNVANVFVDDVVVFNAVPASIGTAANDATSKVETPGTQVVSGDIASTATTSGSAVPVYSFKIRDLATADALSTKVTQVKIKKSSGSADWTDHIAGASLWDGGTQITTGTVTITDADITFPITSGNLDITTGSNKDITLKIWLNTTNIVDNSTMVFTVSPTSHGFTADAAGSTFATDFGASVTGNVMTVRVAASKLLFVQQPTTNTQINTSMTPAVTLEAVDANNIRDLDYVTDVSMTSTGSLSGSPVTATPSSGLATFGTLQHSAVGTGLQLTAASGSLTSALSNPFDIINPLPEINIQSSSFDYFTNSTYSFGNVTSGYYSSAIVFTIQNTGTADLNLTGTPKVVLSGTNASEFIINESMTTTPVTAGSTTTFTITFSPISQGSKSAQISIANNDGTGSENPYIIYLSGTSTVNTVSDIVAKSGYVYPSNIAYASYQAADITGGANDIEIAQFTIRDGGAIADLDNLGTSLNQIVFTVGNSSFIKRIALYDGATEVGTEQAGAGTVTFSGLSLTAADGGTKDFSVRVSFQSTVTDNQQIQLTVAATTSAATTGSTFAATNAGGAATSVSGDDNRIEVTATKLLFVQQPTTNTPINTNMTPAVTVEAVDFNNIRDLNYATLVNITSTGTLTGSPSATPGSGLATFSTLQHSIVGTGLQLTAASGSLTSALSSTFDIISPPIYFNDFGTTLSPPPNENPPSIFASNLSNSLWTTSGVFTNATGGVGNSYCLSVASSSTTSKTFTLTFTVANGYQLDITHFNFWNSRNSNNNSYNNWALSINGTAVGSGSVSYPGGYTGVTAVSSPIAGLTGTITIVYTMSTASSTAYSRLDDFTLYGTVTVLPLPEIDIQGNGNSIVDGDDTPSTSDWTDFGSAVINSGTVDQTYTVNNTGVADLNLTGTTKVVVSGTNASEFTVTAQPGSTVAVGNNTTFTVRFAPTATGLRTATLTIANNDANENPYNFDIQGTGILLPCSGTPTGGTAAASITSATCTTGTNLSLTGQSAETGITLQWQYYDGSTWQDISGGTTNPCTVTGIIATTQYRCNVTCTNSSLTTPSTTVTVTINAPTGGTTAATVNPLCSGSSTTLSLTGATASGVTYIWESSTDGVIYTPIGGAIASTYVASPIANTYYHCILTCTSSSQNSTSVPLQVTMNTTATNVTLLGATVDNLQSLVSWTAPGCYSEVLVVASTGIANTGTPTGDGTAYSANAVFSSGTPLGNGFVVYKGTASSQLVTGLTNGTTYYYKIFTRNGMNWSSGVEVNATPALISATGIIFSGANNSSNCVSGTSGTWVTNNNWCGGVLPSATTIAQFGALGTNPLLSFNMNGATAAQKTVGAIELLNSNAIDRNLRNSSTTVNGSMTLMGVVVNSTSNVIIRNNSSNLFTITGNNSGNILGLDLGNSTNNIINIDGSGGVTISAIITGTGKALTKAGSGTGVLTLSGANTYSGGTTISSGTLQLGAAGVLADAGTITLSGGTFSTGATTGFTETAGTLNLNASTASTIALGTGDHTLTFANSSSLSPWGAGATLVITGWGGTVGQSNTGGGKIIVGVGGLTAAQLAKISFLGYPGTPIILGNGELVPSAPAVSTFGGTGNWNDAIRWDNGIPTPATDAIINGSCTLTSAGTCDDLTINPLGNLTVNSGQTLTINGQFLIASDATGTGSFIDNGTVNYSGNATMQRYMPNRRGYHYYSSPFDGALNSEFADEIGTIITGDPYVGNDTTHTVTPFPNFYIYNETKAFPTISIGWDAASNTLQTMKGYCINFGATTAPLTTDISGTLNSGAYSIGLTNTPSTNPNADGWNLVGNPYPSPIDWQNGAWTKTNVNDGIYYFKATTQYKGTYSSFVGGVASNGGTGIIPSMQGFFVKATGAGSLGVNNAVRIHSNPLFFKSTVTSKPLLRIKGYPSSNQSAGDETVIYFETQATNTFDGNFDAYKFMNNDLAFPNLYTSYNGSSSLSINALPPLSNTDVVVPLGYITRTNGSFTINATEILNFDPAQHIYLEDNQTSTLQDLTLNPVYTFTTTANAPQYRFFIRFSPTIITGIGENSVSFVDAWSSGKDIYINFSSTMMQKAVISIYNMLGQKVIYGEQEGIGTSQYRLEKPGCYIVNVISGSRTYQKKIVLL